MPLGDSELILNSDGSIYHLNLLPEDIGQTIITVGDPERVPQVSKHFDRIEVQKGKREFLTNTGTLGGKRISVISTGIGTDNIDIVLNELDALANIDFTTRSLHKKQTVLDIIRIGTSGTLQVDIPLNSILISSAALGMDNLLYHYQSESIRDLSLEQAVFLHLKTHLNQSSLAPYGVWADDTLAALFREEEFYKGITVTNPGFYGPQGRTLRIPAKHGHFTEVLAQFEYQDLRVTNLEMETSGIYGMALLLGHRALSVNCILANRATGKFSQNPSGAMEKTISTTLEKIATA